LLRLLCNVALIEVSSLFFDLLLNNGLRLRRREVSRRGSWNYHVFDRAGGLCLGYGLSQVAILRNGFSRKKDRGVAGRRTVVRSWT